MRNGAIFHLIGRHISAVDNEQEMVKKCEALGGKVYVRMELDKIGKVTVVADRQDAVFVLFEAAEGAYEPIPTSWQ